MLHHSLSWYWSPLSVSCARVSASQAGSVHVDDTDCYQGMFNALNGVGGGGQLSAQAVDASNSALYATFSVVGFFAGTITNTLGIKVALSFGGIGYSIYVSAYLCYDYTQNIGYVVASGFILGCCAGVLWSAQGQIMMSYPPEASKGRYIFCFWAIFNCGGVIGSLVRSTVRQSV